MSKMSYILVATVQASACSEMENPYVAEIPADGLKERVCKA
jgi:hypothetical protein